jgi:ATP-binding protein involved in chromosome partitioning
VIDPRPAAAARRLAQVARLVAVTGGKGGIGKSLVAAGLALEAARTGRAVGLLDLDLTSACAHLLLGAPAVLPREAFGVVPPHTAGVASMSIAYFLGDRPAALRGTEVSHALVELLAITQWGPLELLVIDMPPGLGDALLDAVRLLPRAEYLVVATASPVVLATVGRTLALLSELRRPVLGVIENMERAPGAAVATLAAAHQAPFLGSLPFDEAVEEAFGDPRRLAGTRMAEALRRIVAEQGW